MRCATSEGWRQRGLLFDTAAADYLEGRPGYPPQVYELLRGRCGLRPGCSVLEVGPGAGQATLPLLDAGARVTAVEPGADLAETLRARTRGRDVEVMVSRLEDAQLPESSFDLVVSATAFHWVQPRVGFPKCGRLLTAGGWLALWWTVWGDPSRPDPLHERLRPILARKAPQLLDEGTAPGRYVLDSVARRAEFALADVLGVVEQHDVVWTGHHDAAQTRALFASFSPWLALDAAVRTELLDDIQAVVRDDFDDHVARPYLTVMYVAQRLDGR